MSRFASRRRGAYTLVELLVVLTIMVILIASTLAVAKKVMEDTRGREASRQLNTWLTLARTRAALTGRPCGIFMELSPILGNTDPAVPLPVVRQSTRFYIAEVPPMYAGGTPQSRGRIMDDPNDTVAVLEFVPLYWDTTSSKYLRDTAEMSILQTLIEPGQVGPPLVPGEHFVVRFDYKGAWYSCQRGPATSHPNYTTAPTDYQDTNKLYFLNSAVGGATAAPPGTGQSTDPGIPGYPFQILRQPRRIGKPLEVSGGSAVDLTFSGIGPQGGQASLARQAIALMFMPGGSVESIWADGVRAEPTGTVHFLVGRADRVTVPDSADPDHASGVVMFNPEKSNLSDPNSLWVSIGRNGSVTTSDNFVPPVDEASLSATQVRIFAGTAQQQDLDPTNPAHQAVYLSYCRELATGRDVKGGR
jgi:type II secretory pathway pseudopilin PulG